MQITLLTHKFRNVERNLHCDIVHITTVWVSSLTLDCNGVFAIKAHNTLCNRRYSVSVSMKVFPIIYNLTVTKLKTYQNGPIEPEEEGNDPDDRGEEDE